MGGGDRMRGEPTIGGKIEPARRDDDAVLALKRLVLESQRRLS